LDEADEMLSMGFWDDVMWLLKRLPKERQTLLFSATIPFPIERAARSFLSNPERVDLSGSAMSAAAGIEHFMYKVDERLPKPRNLLYLLEVERPTSCIVFCNTRSDVDLLSNYLGNLGYDIEALSGALSQNQRERVLTAIKGGRLRMMVATDVAARGIDISNLSHVFMYNLPEDPEVYIHRAGRTGRIGKKGVAVSLVSGTDEQCRTILKRDFQVTFVEKTLPDPQVIAAMRSERIVKQLVELAEQAEVSQHTHTAEAVLASDQAKQVVAFLLKQYLSKANRPSLLGAPVDKTDPGEISPKEQREARQKPREREPREHREQHDKPAPREDHGPRKVFVNLGELDGLKQGELVPLLAELAGVTAESFTQEEVRRTSSFVRVADDAIEAVLAVNGKDRNGKAVVIEKARRR
jgi:ATP-dependent RNA helicase DeaD